MPALEGAAMVIFSGLPGHRVKMGPYIARALLSPSAVPQAVCDRGGGLAALKTSVPVSSALVHRLQDLWTCFLSCQGSLAGGQRTQSSAVVIDTILEPMGAASALGNSPCDS